MQIVLVGNYGIGNAGDECLSSYFSHAYPEHIWIRLSANGEKDSYPFFPAGIRSLFGTRWWRTVRLIKRSDAVVFGGGTLFTDQESVAACFIWFVHATAAYVLRKPILLAFQGFGPFRTFVGRFLARQALKRAAYCSVRDAISGQRFLSLCGGNLGKKSTECIQSFDPTILYLEGKNHDIRTNNLYILIPRFSPGWTSSVFQGFAALLAGADVQILSLHPADPREQHLCRQLASSLHAQVCETASLSEAVSLCSRARLVLSQRYHGCIAALCAGVPFCAIAGAPYDKLASLASECGCKSFSLEDLTGCADCGVLLPDANEDALLLKRTALIDRARMGEESLREKLRSLVASV